MHIQKRFIVLAALVWVCLPGISSAAATAQSVTFNTMYPPSGPVDVSTDGKLDASLKLCTDGRDDEPGSTGFKCRIFITNLSMSITENVQIINLDTGTPVQCGGNVPKGTRLKFSFVPHVSQDVYWFGIGGPLDSPYGTWNTGAISPRMTDSAHRYSSGDSENGAAYGNLSVNPPDESMSGIAGLGCDAGVVVGTGAAIGKDTICTSPTEGTHTAVFNYAPTYAYMYLWKGGEGGADWIGGRTFEAANGALRTGQYYTLQVPAQQISCPITIGTGGTPPTIPTVAEVGACTAGTSHSYTLTSTATDSATTLRYGLDWNNDSTVDEWVPATGYVPQGTSQTAVHTWSTGGAHTFKALAQDAHGNSSAFTTHTVNCANGDDSQPPVALLTANPQTVLSGTASTLQWSSAHATSCTGTGFNTGGATSGTVSTGPLTADKSYSVTCTNSVGSDTDNTTVNVTVASCPAGFTGTPPNCVCSPTNVCSGNNVVNSCTGEVIDSCASPLQCSAGACVTAVPNVLTWKVTPTLVKKNKTTNVEWNVEHVSSCTVSGTNGDSWTGISGTKVSGPIPTQTVFTLNCIALAGSRAPNVTRSTTVNIIPTFQEK